MLALPSLLFTLSGINHSRQWSAMWAEQVWFPTHLSLRIP